MFVALGDAGAVHHARRAFFHTAIAGDGHGARTVGASNHFIAGALAESAVLKSHGLKEYGRGPQTASGPRVNLCEWIRNEKTISERSFPASVRWRASGAFRNCVKKTLGTALAGRRSQ